MRKILYVSGTRAEYGLMRETLFAIRKNPALKIEVAATGMHLMSRFGSTLKEIKKDGFKTHPIAVVYKKDNCESMVDFLGKFIPAFLEKVKRIKPDVIFVQGDRMETLGGAIVGTYLGIPVCHTHGGDTTSTADEITRHAVTKLAHIHFPATKKSAERIIKMGEDSWRVHIVGAPGLDSILKTGIFPRQETAKRFDLNLSKPILIALQHPAAAEDVRETMEAIKELKCQAVVIYPSADPGSSKVIKAIERYRKYSFVRIYKNITHKDYLSLMGIANAMIGNSSSGIIETPSFHLPAVNIGCRQAGRERAGNVIDVECKKERILGAVKKALFDSKFKKKVKKIKNPFGDGKAGERIAKVLAQVRINEKLLNKKIAY